MNTLILEASKKEDIEKAGELLRLGGLVAIPTETVYGLAANALDGNAVKKIYEAKARPSDNPLIIHVEDFAQTMKLTNEMSTEKLEMARSLAEKFWPGPLTIILPKSDIVPEETSGGLDTVALRCPASKAALEVIKAAGVPLAAPSANLSGRPSPTTFEHVLADMEGRVDAILRGEDCVVGVESTIISLAHDTPRLLRPGAVTLEELEALIGHIEADKAVTEKLAESEKPISPGMKYQHYSPSADITILDTSPEAFVTCANERGEFALCYEEDAKALTVPHVTCGTRYDSQKQAARLFSALHELDEQNAEKVLAFMPKRTGVGLAVYNRLVRAAGYKVENPTGDFLLGLTGSTGAGKTTAAKLLEELGCASIDCDQISRSSEVYDEECIKELSEVFGEDIAEDGVLNRKLLAQRAFASDEGKSKLNAITHPRILVAVREEIKKARAAGKKLIFVDAPTLFEASFDRICARIVVVTAPEELRMERIMKRDGISPEQAKSRMNAMKSEEFYVRRADYVIDGRDKAEMEQALEKMVKELHAELERAGVCK